MKVFIALSTLFVLSAASFRGNRSGKCDSVDVSGDIKLNAEGDEARLVSEVAPSSSVFWTLPADIFNLILGLADNDHVKMAQVSRFYYESTRDQHRAYLVSRLSATGGVATVCDRLKKSFADNQQGRLRDGIIAQLVALVRSRKSDAAESDGTCRKEMMQMFLHFKRPITEQYDMLLGRGAFNGKFQQDDLLELQRLLTGKVQWLKDLVFGSADHQQDLHAVLSMDLPELKESKCVLLVNLLMGARIVPSETVTALADSIHPRVMPIVARLNRDAPISVIIDAHDGLREEKGDCLILAGKLFDIVKRRGDLKCANELSRCLGLPCIATTNLVRHEISDLLYQKFTEKHQFTFEQCAMLLKRHSLEAVLHYLLDSGDEVTIRIQNLMLSVFGEGMEGESVDAQLYFHALILKDVTTFSKWDQVGPALIAHIATDLSKLCPFLTANQRNHILSNTAPTLSSPSNKDDLMVKTYFYLTGNERWHFLNFLSPQQAINVLNIASRDNLPLDIKIFLESRMCLIKSKLFEHVHAHPDYVAHPLLLPLLFLYSSSDAFRAFNWGNVTADMLAHYLHCYRVYFSDPEQDAARRRSDDFVNGSRVDGTA